MTAALPRVLNQDILAVLTPSDQARQLFTWLCGLPFVEQQAGFWKYHDVVRSAMLRLQRARSPADWRAQHLTLAQAHARWAAEIAGDPDGIWSNQGWVTHTGEETYHLLCADPAGNLPRVFVTAVNAAASSHTRARQWAMLIADAGRDTDNPALRQWGQCLGDAIHDSDLTQYLTYLIDQAKLDKMTLALAFQERGEHHQLGHRYDDGIADFSRAIELDPNRKWAITRRGQIYLATGHHANALADFSRAIDLDPSYTGAIASRGLAYRATGRYDEALADLTQAIDLDPALAWAIASRGQAYLATGHSDEALADLTRAIDLDPSLVAVIAHQGQAQLLSAPALTAQQVRDGGGDPDCEDLIRLPPQNGVVQFPAFQFGPDARPIPVVVAINRLLKAAEDPWGVADWWLGSNVWLEGVPAYLLGHVDDKLLTLAAQTEFPEG